MRRVVYILLLVACGVSCIDNDIPLPYIKGEVLKFEVNGQKEAKIDNSKQVITVILEDTVDITSSKIKLFEFTPDATCSLAQGNVVDLANTLNFDITTYQLYKWKVETTQPINRHILVENQIGDAEISVASRTAIVRVAASQDLDDVHVLEFQLGPSIATTMPDPLMVTDFSGVQTFDVSCFGRTEQWKVYVMVTEQVVTTGEPNTFARFAYLSGSIQAGSSETSSFEYRKASEENWRTAEAVVAGNKITAKIVGLTPNTPYVVRAKLGQDVGDEVQFTTEQMLTIENLDFESWTQDGKKWFPNATAANTYWATGNQGVILAGKDSNAVPVTGADAKKGTAVKMTTIGGVLYATMAAGNLFTGIYKNEGLPTTFPAMKKQVVFGRPYAGRPTKLIGWFKYTPAIVDVQADPAFPFPDFMGKPDWADIYIRLENWGGATERPEQSLVKVIAFGEFKTNVPTPQYTKFECEIEYSDLLTKPTHVVLVATSSINGGDFSGGIGSVLYIDEFSLGWD